MNIESCDYKSDSKWRKLLYSSYQDLYEYIEKLVLIYPIYPDYNDEYFKRYLENLSNQEADIE